MKVKNIRLGLVLLALTVLVTPVVVGAAEPDAAAIDAAKEELQTNINIVWTCVAAFLVFFMQAGFAMVEAGFTRGVGQQELATPDGAIGPQAGTVPRHSQNGGRDAVLGRAGRDVRMVVLDRQDGEVILTIPASNRDPLDTVVALF